MPFEGLSDKLSAVFKKMRNKGRLKESDIKAVSYTHLTLPTIA